VVQVVGGQELGKLRAEDVVEIIGQVKARSEKLVNLNLATGKVEIQLEEVRVLAHAAELPFDLGARDLKLELPTLLDYRPLSLRHPKIRAIFKVQEVIVDAFRETLKGLGFTEFQAPTIVPTATEGGAQIFPVKWYEHDAYLCQSPQLYKQILVGVYERVFSVARAYRAEPSVTTRHLSEYVSLDAEMGFIDSYEDVMGVVEMVVRGIFRDLDERASEELKLFEATVPKLAPKIPRIKMRQAQEIIFKRTGVDHRQEPDLEPEGEREICRWAAAEEGSELVFVTHYPMSKRPFYTFADPNDPEYSMSFDLLGRGLEWVTGGRRLNLYQEIVEGIKKKGNKPEDFEIYLQAFKYGMPSEGGFALGAERITMQVLGLENIREASLFPRDMERIDFRLASKKVDHFGRVKELLDKAGVRYQSYEHEAVYTSEQAAKVRGTDLKQGVKALVLVGDEKPVMVVVSADKQVDLGKVKVGVGCKLIRLAKAEEVEKYTGGVRIGAVPPLGNLYQMPVYVDRELGENKEIAFNAGLNTRSVKIKYDDFVKVVNPQVGSFSSSNPCG
jgi:nondiscriminating aspartyl-tRNA synthetase